MKHSCQPEAHHIATAPSFKALRTRAGFKQEELALKLGVSGPAVIAWENGKSYPRTIQLPLLSTLLNATEREIITSIGRAAAIKGYVCPVCKHGSHRLEAVYCIICGREIEITVPDCTVL